MAVKEIQQDLYITDDLSPYRGSWVSIRDGKVVASALDPVELRNGPDHREDDLLVLVPSQARSALLL